MLNKLEASFEEPVAGNPHGGFCGVGATSSGPYTRPMSSSYHVLSDAFERYAAQPQAVAASPSREPAIEARTKALEMATKGRAYGAMETLGLELSRRVARNESVVP